MHVLATRWPDLRHLHPLVLGESCGHNLVGVLHVAGRWEAHWLWHLYDLVRLRDVPAFDPLTWRRRIFGRACGRTSIDPRSDKRDLLRRERWIIGELSKARIGKPRRHLFRLHCLFDGRGPR